MTGELTIVLAAIVAFALVGGFALRSAIRCGISVCKPPPVLPMVPPGSKPTSDQSLFRQVDRYHELLLAVETAHPGETRHETALRYIREREVRYEGRPGRERHEPDPR